MMILLSGTIGSKNLELSSNLMKDFYKNKRILITGSSGYLATNIVDELKEIDCQIIRLSRSRVTLIPQDCVATIENISGDIRYQAVWDQLLKSDINVIFHLAAQTSVSVADENPTADFEVNVLPMLNMLESCRRSGKSPTILFAGTVTQVGIPGYLPVDEKHPENPITMYDFHKLMAEKYLKYYVKKGIVQGVCLRLANVFGPGPGSSSTDRGILNRLICKAVNGEALTIYGKGDNVRDYIYIADVVSAFLTAGAKIERINGQHFVIGSGTGHTIAEAVKLVAQHVEKKTELRVPVTNIERYTQKSLIETRNFIADISAFKHATGWSPSVNLTHGIDLTIGGLL